MKAVRVGVFVLGLLGQGAAWAESASDLRTVSAANGSLELRAGDRRLAEVKLSTPAPRRLSPSLREVVVEGRRVVEVRVAIQGEQAAEVWLASMTATGVAPIWTGRIGTVDRDGELSRELVLDANGLHLYETASRISRCDGEPVRLQARRWDFSGRRWRDGPADLPPLASPPLVARRGAPNMPAGRPRISFPFTASSLPPAGTDRSRGLANLVAPLALSDGDAETVWAEGDPSDGRGEVLVARARSDGQAVVGLRILPGDTRSREAFLARARPKSLLLIFGRTAEERFEVLLNDHEPIGADSYRQPFWIPLPRPVPSSCLTIVVREVTPGNDARERLTSAWGDIDVFTDLDGDRGLDRLVSGLQATDCEPRVGDVVAVGPEVLPRVVAALPAAAGGALDCVLEALSRLAPPSLPEDQQRALAEGLSQAVRGASVEQERQIVTLLGRLPPSLTEPVAALLRDPIAPVEDRARAAQVLAGLDRPAAWQSLLDQVGKEPAEMRAILRGLWATAPAERGAAVLAALDETAPAESARRADLVSILGTLAARSAAPAGDLTGRLGALATAEQEAFEVRARALMALAARPEERALAALDRVRSTSPEAPLRTLAVRAIATRAEVAALPALRAALDDRDPGVRQVAVETLGRRRDKSATPLIIAAAKQEPWPTVRRAEIGALGRLCGREATDLIVRAIERDVDDVRRAAMQSLVSCQDRRAPRLLLTVLARTREKPPLRTQASLLLGQIKDPGTASDLAAALERLLVEARSDLALEAAATGTLRALGEVGGPVALKAALRVRSDSRAVLRRSANEVLGRLCDPGPGAEALRAATQDPDAGVAAAASAALRRCGSASGGRTR